MFCPAAIPVSILGREMLALPLVVQQTFCDFLYFVIESKINLLAFYPSDTYLTFIQVNTLSCLLYVYITLHLLQILQIVCFTEFLYNLTSNCFLNKSSHPVNFK